LKIDVCILVTQEYNLSTDRSCACCSGEFTAGIEKYKVKPVDGTLTGRHRVYRESDNKEPRHYIGM